MIADRDEAAAAQLPKRAGSTLRQKEFAAIASVDIRKPRFDSQSAFAPPSLAFGGIDILINTAAIFPSSPDGNIHRRACGPRRWTSTSPPTTCLPTRLRKSSQSRICDGNIVLTSSANAVVAKRGSEAYDVSKAALSHLMRELAVSLAPKVRVNGISPATVVKGITMFPRDRVRASLTKYNIPFRRIAQRRRTAHAAGRVLCRAHADASAHRSGRLRRGDPLPGQPPGALHHGPRDSRRRRPDRGFPAMTFVARKQQCWCHPERSEGPAFRFGSVPTSFTPC